MPGRNDCTVILSERSESKNLLAQQKTASHGKKMGTPAAASSAKRNIRAHIRHFQDVSAHGITESKCFRFQEIRNQSVTGWMTPHSSPTTVA